MTRQLSTDIEVAGKRYAISKLKARDASWVLSVVLQKALPGGAEMQFTGLATGRAQASKEEFDAIQGLCLASCAYYPEGSSAAVPIFSLPDQWLRPELEYDMTSVLQLTVQTLVYNLAPFFADGGLQQLLSSIGSLNPPTVVGSTGS